MQQKFTEESAKVVIPLVQEDIKNGMKTHEACAKHGMTYAQYYYWAMDTKKNQRLGASTRIRRPYTRKPIPLTGTAHPSGFKVLDANTIVPDPEYGSGSRRERGKRVFVLYGSPNEVAETIRSLQ